MIKNNPLVSVILPNYNHADYLNERIDSILNQDYKNFELIILDDFSTDNSVDVIKSYSDSKHISQIVINTENSGSPFSQWNKGFLLSKGKYIWIAESDDCADSKFLSSMINTLECTNSILCYSDSAIINENDEILHSKNSWAHNLNGIKWTENHTESGLELLAEQLRYRNVISNASAVVFKKSELVKIKFNYAYFRFAGDWMFWSQLCYHGDVSYISKSLNKWRSHKKSTRNAQTLDNEYKRIEEILEVVKYNNQNLDKQFKINNKKYFWIIDYWLSRFSYANLKNKQYRSPSFTGSLKYIFYKKLFFRTLKEVKNSVFKKL